AATSGRPSQVATGFALRPWVERPGVRYSSKSRQVLVPVASSLPVSTEVSFASAVAVFRPLWITTDSARTAPVSRRIGRRYLISSVWLVYPTPCSHVVCTEQPSAESRIVEA